MDNSIEQKIARAFVDDMEADLEQFLRRPIRPRRPYAAPPLLAPLGCASSATMNAVQEGY